MSKYSLLINLETLEELSDFLTLYNKVYSKVEEKKTVKTISDKRGSKTVGLHQRAKEYRTSHPELSYKECLIFVSKPEQKQEPEVEPEHKSTIEIYEENITI